MALRGMRYTANGMSAYISVLVSLDNLAILVGELAHDNHYQVYESPYAAAASRQQLGYAASGLADIETVDSETSEKNA